MMMETWKVLLSSSLVLLLVRCILATHIEKVLYVRPTETTNCSFTPCFTLDEYTSSPGNINTVFQSNTGLVFLPGTHLLSTNAFILIRDVSTLYFLGSNQFVRGAINALEPLSRIQCTGTSGFVFINVSSLFLTNLTITDCGFEITDSLANEVFFIQTSGVHITGIGQQAALFLVNVYDLLILSCSIQNSKGYGLLGVNVIGASRITSTFFLANNQYTLQLPQCQVFTDTDAATRCNGGNAHFIFEDLLECPQKPVKHSLVIESSTFAFGTSIFGAILPEITSSRGTGIGITLSQSSYGVDVVLDGVFAYGNIGKAGTNIYLAMYESVDNSTIFLQNVSSTQANNVLPPQSRLLGISASTSGGMHFNYGIARPVGPAYPRPVCVSDIKHQDIVLAVRDSNFRTNNAVAGTGIYLILQFSLPIASPFVAKLFFENCLVYNNTGVTGAGMYVTESSAFSTQARSHVILRNVTFLKNGYFQPLRTISDVIDSTYYNGIQVVSISNVTFLDCTFAEGEGSAISAFESNILFGGTVTFVNNTGFNGGALDLRNSYIYLTNPTLMNFTDNYAVHTGGAISVVGRDDLIHACFFQIEDPDLSPNPRVVIVFDGNYAEDAGNAVYGGSIDACTITARSVYSGTASGSLFDAITVIGNEDNSTSSISSDPFAACFCENNVPRCDRRTLLDNESYSVFPGQSFEIPLVATGQRSGTVPSIISAIFGNSSTPATFQPLEVTQQVEKHCTNLTYTITSPNRVEAVVFLPQSASSLTISSAVVVFNILPCPLGFQLSNGVCECDSVIQNHNLSCNLNEQTVQREGDTWVNASFSNGVYDGVILYENCPYDYCLQEATDVHLNDPDTQCAFGHTGILCGGCPAHLSAVLGTSQCRSCSNAYLAQLIYFAAAGILLVILLFLLDLTVVKGTLEGLVFYANIVRLNQATFLSSGQTNILTVFIAWINLDLGIEVCFYNGMDAYAKTWLQFVFPLYIWLIVFIIILLSRRFHLVLKLARSKAVPVLATLLLLSYTKVLRTVITALSASIIDLPDGTPRTVWSYDGNMEYLGGKHLALFLIALIVLVLLVIPYTLLLLLTPIRFVQSMTNHRVLSWVNKLKPFLDAHHSQYKDAFRNWTGLLLLFRIGLSLSVSINVTDDENVNLLIILVSVFLLLGFAWGAFPFLMCRVGDGGVYRKWPLSVLECSFFVNLGVLAASTLYIKASGGNQDVAFYLSVSVALLTFVGVLIYHTAVIFKDNVCVQRYVLSYLHGQYVTHSDRDSGDGSVAKVAVAPTTTLVELREPLIEDS